MCITRWGVRRSGVASIERPLTTSQYLSIQCSALLLSAMVLPKFHFQNIPHFDRVWGFKVSFGAIKNGTNRNVDPTFIFDFVTRYSCILHRLAIIYNVADIRQADVAIGTGENATQCYVQSEWGKRSVTGHSRK